MRENRLKEEAYFENNEENAAFVSFINLMTAALVKHGPAIIKRHRARGMPAIENITWESCEGRNQCDNRVLHYYRKTIKSRNSIVDFIDGFLKSPYNIRKNR